jgi:glycosyltransferase involved in cell wall biosynthesis
VATSPWTAERARRDPIVANQRIVQISLGLDPTVYKPIQAGVARRMLNLPPDRPLVLFGAGDPFTNLRKGFGLLEPALQKALVEGERFEVVIFGTSAPPRQEAPDVDTPIHYLGELHDDVSLVAAYSACDLMTVPSIQETFGQTTLEAMACETPVVAFDATGSSHLIAHQRTGYLARPFDPSSFADGIAWGLDDADRRRRLGRAARKDVMERFDLRDRARDYQDLYRTLIRRS